MQSAYKYLCIISFPACDIQNITMWIIIYKSWIVKSIRSGYIQWQQNKWFGYTPRTMDGPFKTGAMAMSLS